MAKAVYPKSLLYLIVKMQFLILSIHALRSQCFPLLSLEWQQTSLKVSPPCLVFCTVTFGAAEAGKIGRKFLGNGLTKNWRRASGYTPRKIYLDLLVDHCRRTLNIWWPPLMLMNLTSTRSKSLMQSTVCHPLKLQDHKPDRDRRLLQ